MKKPNRIGEQGLIDDSLLLDNEKSFEEVREDHLKKQSKYLKSQNSN